MRKKTKNKITTTKKKTGETSIFKCQNNGENRVSPNRMPEPGSGGRPWPLCAHERCVHPDPVYTPQQGTRAPRPAGSLLPIVRHL